jgi:hypothetical protein
MEILNFYYLLSYMDKNIHFNKKINSIPAVEGSRGHISFVYHEHEYSQILPSSYNSYQLRVSLSRINFVRKNQKADGRD